MSKTPLYKKLGIKPDSTILILNQSKIYIDYFSEFPSNVVINEKVGSGAVGFVHIFVSTMKELAFYFELAKSNMKMNGMLWISWPKKSSKLPSQIDKFDIMQYGLDNGLVDVKVASIDLDWSGHKFVYRLKDRK